MSDATPPVSPGQAHPANRLAGEKSPYLLQHARNPVDWHPWGAKAFAMASQEDRPIFLSIGYSTCHWCHVMEHESFADEEVARLLNQTFVCIKVDREERPDIDQVYMTVCQMLTGAGGWPLTILMTPDKRPFFAATYIPKQTRFGRIGMLDLIPQVRDAWHGRRTQVVRSAEQITAHLLQVSTGAGDGGRDIDLVENAWRELANRYDPEHGGFGSAPKFPAPHNLIFLLRYWHRSGAGQALEMVDRTLLEMRRGGLWDHIGHGFHRYSTDREWLVPHFEKMLYDQAMLALAYTEAFQATGSAEHARTARQTLDYVLRRMTSADGAFFSAEDADSEGKEGKFYLWTLAEVRAALSEDDAALAAAVWNLSTEGNFADTVSGRRSGANIPHLAAPLIEVARRLALPAVRLEARLEAIRAALHEARERRMHPLRDDKVLADWNGLMAAAMSRAGQALAEPEYVNAARRAVNFVFERMRDRNGRFLHRYRDGEGAVPAFLDDYAFLTWALLELYEATLEPDHLARAFALQDESIDRFWHREGGLYLTAQDDEPLLVRPREVSDGAIPSGNSVVMSNLLRLAGLTGRTDLADKANAIVDAFAGQLGHMPSAHSHLMSGLLLASGPSLEVVIVGDPEREDTRRLVDSARSRYLPGLAILLVPEGEAGRTIRRLAPFTSDFAAVDGTAAAYVCHDFSCQLPTTDPDELIRALQSKTKKGSEPGTSTGRPTARAAGAGSLP